MLEIPNQTLEGAIALCKAGHNFSIGPNGGIVPQKGQKQMFSNTLESLAQEAREEIAATEEAKARQEAEAEAEYEEQRQDAQRAMADEMTHWYGTLTTKNIDHVAKMIREVLAGHTFATVHVYEYRQWEPEVRLHERLEGGRDGKNVTVHHHSDTHAQIVLCDSYGVDGLSTTRTEDGYDPEFNAPYVVIEHNEVRWTDRTPEGKLRHVARKVERPAEIARLLSDAQATQGGRNEHR